MLDHPIFRNNKNDIKRIGDRLSRRIVWNEEKKDEIEKIFQVANSWRESHALPMRSIRQSVSHKINGSSLNGITAARLKRMVSIRKKLGRSTVELDKMNDLGGCRAILESIEEVNALLKQCKENFPHEIIGKEFDYINNPKDDGYRSHHIVFSFNGKRDKAIYNGRRIELQIRTRLQHSWATAVEAVGLFRNEDMKAGEGDKDWLRLFKLMSDEFAFSEKCGYASSSRIHRVQEIKQLNTNLNAVDVLENIRKATHYAKEYRPSIHGDKPKYYVIRYDRISHSVEVAAYSGIRESSESFNMLEGYIEHEEEESSVVFVEVDKIESLAEAYPNYFGDVSLFIENLRRICGGESAIEYSMAPRWIIQPKEKDLPIDPSWLRPRRHRQWN